MVRYSLTSYLNSHLEFIGKDYQPTQSGKNIFRVIETTLFPKREISSRDPASASFDSDEKAFLSKIKFQNVIDIQAYVFEIPKNIKILIYHKITQNGAEVKYRFAQVRCITDNDDILKKAEEIDYIAPLLAKYFDFEFDKEANFMFSKFITTNRIIPH
eukprot:TRINITY_DN3552_c0_g3_i6.p1 TRINITY_DN3552_c0_g3~~TRINITY_DN3552_c0_g3_i6.p1  ORF type:complete len:158 (-),score=21.75 TRINITY_DN3552_c0_g3_i6:84-557(-)